MEEKIYSINNMFISKNIFFKSILLYSIFSVMKHFF